MDTFRLTSPDKARILAAAKLYGGTLGEWQAPAGPQWEVITDTNALPVIVPPSDMAFTQHYEMWSGGGCQRRCDGRTATFNDNGAMQEGECLCDPDQRECDIHTRLSVMLRDLPGLGLWRLDTQGWNAALELQGAVEILQMAAGRGQMLPAQLRLEQRMVKRPGQQTRRFAVPVLDVEISPAQLLSGNTDPLDAGTMAIETVSEGLTPGKNGARAGGIGMPSPSLTPVPDTMPEWPTPSIAEQAAAEPKPTKRRGQIPIPATGLSPRTAAQVAEPSQLPLDQNRDLIVPRQRQDQDTPLSAESPDLSEPAAGTPPPAEDMQPDVPVDEPSDDVRYITPQQLKKLSILLREAGFDDRDSRHDFVAQAIGRHIDTAKELTLDEASRVIDILENDQPQPGEKNE